MFDSHCHLHDRRLARDCDAAVERACAAGVRGVLLAGVDVPGWLDAAALQARIGQRLEVALAYGIHPQFIAEVPAALPGGEPPALEARDQGVARSLPRARERLGEGGSSAASANGDSDDFCHARLDDQLQALARAVRGEPLTPDAVPLPRPHAIGELGLHAGGHPAVSPARLKQQEQMFRAQLALARQLDLPLVLHIVRAHAEALRILKRDGVPSRGGVVHSYSGSAALVRDYVALGLYISFAGPVTYPESPRVLAAARAVPPERLLVETDAPDQTPWARRPAANEPAFLPDIVLALATHRGQPAAALAHLTENNARRLFGLPNPTASRGEPTPPPDLRSS